MSPKQLLLSLHQKVKDRANLVTDDPELHEYINQLEAEINAMYEAQSDEGSESDPGGNNPSVKPKVP